jgi:hypothetical protein
MLSMNKSDTSYRQYTTSGQQLGEGGRMPMGHAALAMFGLSALGWAVVVGPFFTLLR